MKKIDDRERKGNNLTNDFGSYFHSKFVFSFSFKMNFSSFSLKGSGIKKQGEKINANQRYLIVEGTIIQIIGCLTFECFSYQCLMFFLIWINSFQYVSERSWTPVVMRCPLEVPEVEQEEVVT